MTDSHLPDFQKSGYGSLVSEVTVTRLVVDEAGYIAGAEVRDLDRNTKILRARVYIVACGGLESPRLLLLSRSRSFPNGIGNNHDLVGRFFMEHRPARFNGSGYVWAGELSASSSLRDSPISSMRNSKSLGLGGMTLGFDLEGAIDGREIRAGEIGKALNRVRTRNLEIGIGTEMKPALENRVTLDTKAKDYFGNPGVNLFLKESEEDIRTVARGRKSCEKYVLILGWKKSKNCRGICGLIIIWGLAGWETIPEPASSIEICGFTEQRISSSLEALGFVTSGTANPTLTLTALSLRLSDHLRLQLQSGAFPAPALAKPDSVDDKSISCRESLDM